MNPAFQQGPEVFNGVEVWGLAGPLQDVDMVHPEPCLHPLCRVLGSLSCWNTKCHPKCSSHAEVQRFLANISLYITPFILPLMRTRWPVPELEKQPHSMMLPPPCFAVGMVFWGLNASPFFARLSFWYCGQKV